MSTFRYTDATGFNNGATNFTPNNFLSTSTFEFNGNAETVFANTLTF